jgi:hypothetical protein
MRFLAATTFRSYVRSERAPTERQLKLVWVLPPLAGFVVAVEGVWHLTGRARGIRHVLGNDVIYVVPGPRGLPPGFRSRWEALAGEKREEFERMQAELDERRAEGGP